MRLRPEESHCCRYQPPTMCPLIPLSDWPNFPPQILAIPPITVVVITFTQPAGMFSGHQTIVQPPPSGLSGSYRPLLSPRIPQLLSCRRCILHKGLSCHVVHSWWSPCRNHEELLHNWPHARNYPMYSIHAAYWMSSLACLMIGSCPACQQVWLSMIRFEVSSAYDCV